MKTIILCALAAFGGVVVGNNWPNKPVEYTVTSKTRCLTDDGISFKMRYHGAGIAAFKVLPPNPEKPSEKETKK